MAKKKEKTVIKASSREALINAMRSKYGHDILRQTKAVKAYSSGILELDIASGIGGHKCGGIIEIFGPESTGKSLIALRAIATAQQKYGLPSVLFDTEFGTPEDWMITHGIDPSMMEIPIFKHGEEVFDMALDFAKSGFYAYVIVDSLVGAVPKAILDGSVGDHDVGVVSRMVGKSLKQMTLTLSDVDTNLMVVNQIRMKIPQGGVQMGSPETTPGGNALKFYATQRVRTGKKPQSEFRRDSEVVGHTVFSTYKKNKSAPPLRKAEFKLDYFRGVNNVPDLLHRGVALDLIEVTGNTHVYKGAKAVGSKKFMEELQNDPILSETLWEEIVSLTCHHKKPIIESDEEVPEGFKGIHEDEE